MCSYQIVGDEQLNVSPTQLPLILSATCSISRDDEDRGMKECGYLATAVDCLDDEEVKDRR